MRKITSSAVIALMAIQAAAPALSGVAEAAAAFESLDVAAPAKGDFGLKDAESSVSERRKPNVLFMIDTSVVMQFSMKGIMPTVALRSEATDANIPKDSAHPYFSKDSADWDATKAQFGLTFDDVVKFMKDASFGVGSLPYVISSLPPVNSPTLGTNLYGRDVDSSNNYNETSSDPDRDMEKYRNDYYFPFADDGAPVREAFKNQVPINIMPDATPTWDYANIGPGALPYALVFKDPRHWDGWKGPGVPSAGDLVPNDSRMYKTKLVLWRMLGESTLFNDVRFGLATPFAARVGGLYQPHLRAQMQSGWWGSVASSVNGKSFANGTMGYNVTGNMISVDVDMGGKSMQHRVGWGTKDTSPVPLNLDTYRAMNRGYLRVPIADRGRTITKSGRSAKQIDLFKMWIDGVSDGKTDFDLDLKNASRQFYYETNPELVPTGIHQLANAIFFNPSGDNSQTRQDYLRRRWVWYAKANADSLYSMGGANASDNAYTRGIYAAGSGEAAGSVLDFFSPPVFDNDFGSLYGDNGKELDNVSFPITDVCEDNWVILFTSGHEVSADINGLYHVRDAIKNLYDHTGPKKNRVTVAAVQSDGTRKVSERALANPIRTIVVGMAADPNDLPVGSAERRQVTILRENLNKMARAGQGYDFNDASAPVSAFFADDVPSLSRAIEEALAYIIVSQKQPDSGPLLESPGFDDDEKSGDINLFSSEYSVVNNDQWLGELTRFKASVDEQARFEIDKAWNLGESIMSRAGGRNLKYWKDGGLRDLSGGLDDFRRLTGMTPDRMSAQNLPGGSFGALAPHEALYRWYQGFDYSYVTRREYPRDSMLSDFGQSGALMVGEPARADSLPGYREWADAEAARLVRQKPMIYTQTNDGILHVVDPVSGAERMAILPPPVLVPGRLPSLKTQRNEQGKMEWIDVKGRVTVGLPLKKSNAVHLLDGPLQKRYFDVKGMGNPNDWGIYVFGTMGRAGGGMYMYDASAHDNPKFMWYRENLHGSGKLLAMDGAMNEPVVRSPGDREAAYLKLGLNSPRPRAGVTMPPSKAAEKTNSFIALSGGVQSGEFDPAANGGEGAVLLMIDPADGSVIKSFDSASVKSGMRVGGGEVGEAPYMGMMTSPPALVRSSLNKYYTGQLFAADNRGNIFRAAFERAGSGGVAPIPRNEWEMETVATLQNSSASNRGSDSYAVPHGLNPAFHQGSLWLAGGTADAPVAKRGGDGGSFLKNEAQFIFAFRHSGEQTAPMYRDRDWKRILDDGPDGDPNLALAPDDGKEGWYIQLRESAGFSEMVSANTIVTDGVLYVGTFIQSKVEIADASSCGTKKMGGKSRLYALNLTTGAAALWENNKKFLEIDGIKITGLTESSLGGTHNLLVTYEALHGDGAEGVSDPNLQHIKNKDLKFFNVFLGTGGGAARSNVPPGEGVMIYWRLKSDVDSNLLD